MSTSHAEETHSILVKPLPKYMAVMSRDGIEAAVPVVKETGQNITWTTDPSIELPIKLSVDPSCMSSRPPITLIDQFAATVKQYGSNTALAIKRNGVYKKWLWDQYFTDVTRFAQAAIVTGLQPHQCVSIMGFNSPEWVIADIGTIFAGGMAAGIYTTNGTDATWYIAHHSESVIAVVEDATQTEKFVSVQSKLPHLRCIVQWSGDILPQHKATGIVVTWEEFLSRGDGGHDGAAENSAEELTAVLRQRLEKQRPGHCCSLIYTSGTTGNPKAVMLSHDNCTWTAAAALSEISITAQDAFVSYLPLSHVAAQLLDIHIPMLTGASVTFAQPDALKGSLVETLQEVRPTVFFGVPRVWEKIQERMQAVGASNGMIKQYIGAWAKNIGLSGNQIKLDNLFKPEYLHQSPPWGWFLADRVVFSNVKLALGLDRTRLRATAAAPISKETLDYFSSLDLPILSIYGLSESTGPATINLPHRQKAYTVGSLFPGAYLKLAQTDQNGQGEICLWGRHIFMGYLKDETNTRAALSLDGFLHTGDLGNVDEFGFLSITGRLKELLITAGGENVAPVPIEDAIKAELPMLSNVMVIGDQRKYLTCLLALKTDEIDGIPNDTISDVGHIALSEAGIHNVPKKITVQELLQNTTLRNALINTISQGIARANKNAVSQAQIVQKFTILVRDFSQATGELTPTLKLKRKVVHDMHQERIDDMYQDNGGYPIKAVHATAAAKL